MAIISNILPMPSEHLHSLQVENCDSNSRLVVDEDDNGKFRPEKETGTICYCQLSNSININATKQESITANGAISPRDTEEE